MAGDLRHAVTLADVRAYRDQIVALGHSTGITNIRVFGSVARGEAGADSDLDLLVDVESGRGCLDMTRFALGVEGMVGVLTQVATVSGLKERIRGRVLAEAVAV